jgi:hypothetical protein
MRRSAVGDLLPGSSSRSRYWVVFCIATYMVFVMYRFLSDRLACGYCSFRFCISYELQRLFGSEFSQTPMNSLAFRVLGKENCVCPSSLEFDSFLLRQYGEYHSCLIRLREGQFNAVRR